MSEFKLPHVEDLDTNSYLIRQLIENFKAIEQEDKDDDQALSDEVTDRKKGDGNLQGQINKLQERCQKLEQEKATKDDLETVKSEFFGRIKSIYMGKDSKAIRDIILDMKEKGEI